MLRKRLGTERMLSLLLPLLVLFGLCSFAIPVDPKSAITTTTPSNPASQPPILRKPLRIFAPPVASANPSLTVTQPLEIHKLSTEELFKAILIHDTLAAASTPSPPPGLMASKPPRTGWAAYQLPSFLDYPISTTPSHLVRFDATKQPVQLARNPRDVSEAVRSYAFNTFYVCLDQLQPASSPSTSKGAEGIFAQVKRPTVDRATRMVTKEALVAQEKVRNWAKTELGKSTGRQVKEEEVEKSLDRTWEWWRRGLQEAIGSGYVPVDQMRAKILR